MVAEALEEKAKQMGITIKVETDGSGGTKNAPTAKEIEECEAIIVAADKNVEMARFNGKPVIQVKVADGVNKAEELINEALSGNAPIYHADHISTTVESENDESVGRQIYKHLMNGVSHMLPFVIVVISNPLGYLFALAIGSVVGMFGLALLKKPLK